MWILGKEPMWVDLDFGGGGAGGPASPDPFMSANADFYISQAPSVDNPLDVTTVTMQGKIGGTLARAGATGSITLGGSGLVFPGGRQLQLLAGLSGTYEGALILLDVTATSNPASTATVARAEDTIGARCLIRQTTIGTWQGLGPNNGSNTFPNAVANGSRQVMGFVTDRQGTLLGGADRQAIIERDGFRIVSAATPTTANLVLDSLLFGQNFVGTIHRVAIFLIPVGGGLPETPEQLWARMAGVTLNTFSTSGMDLIILDGQSLAVGPIISGTEATYNLYERNGVRILLGMQDSAANAITSLVRPGALAYNETVPATGTGPAVIDNNLNMALPVAAALTKFRPSGQNPVLVSSHAIAGEEIADMDGSVVTGSGAIEIFNNNDYWCDQAAAILTAQSRTVGAIYKVLIQGTADRNAATGYWQPLAQAWWDNHRTDIIAAFPSANPIMVLGQSAGDTDTTTGGETWNVKLEQVALASVNNGLLIPEYQFTVADTVHPGPASTIRFGETIAWAIRQRETGGNWNLGAPTASRAGGTITLTYPAWATLEIAPDPYGGFGISNSGFEVTGATITGVSVSGNVVTITTSGGTPTQVQYAMQVQNASAFPGNQYTAHRGLLRTTQRNTGPFSGTTLFNFAPSFRVTV
jgi:hypothetical protein